LADPVEVEPEPETIVLADPVEVEPEPETIVLADPVVVDGGQGDGEAPTEGDRVLAALIQRIAPTHQEMAAAAAELAERSDIDPIEVAEVLAELVDGSDPDQVQASERLEELTFFSEEVPRRPGQLTDFANLDPLHKRRVIIRVLCLLVARSEDEKLLPREPRSEAETRQWPLSRAVWPLPPPEADEDLPARQRLARSRR